MRTNDNGAPKVGNPQPTRGWAELTPWNASHIYAQRGAKYETRSRLAALMKQQVERLAIPLGNWKTVAKWLVIAIRLGYQKTIAKSLVMVKQLAIRLGYQKTIAKSLVMLLGVVLLFFTALAATPPAWAAGKDTIAVIYPDIGEPYREIFEKIIEGVEDKVGAQVAKYPVNSDTEIGKLTASLLRQNTKVAIALGRQGMKAAIGLNNADIRVVVGGVLTVPDNETSGQPVISLSPDPALLFARMKTLMPSTKRVFVVYDPGFNGWMIKLAKEAARAQGLELVAYEALDVRSAVKLYQRFFSDAEGQADVLWLPQDPTTVEDSSILPMVLQESWNQGIAVFSSNFSHVRRGVLFSLYPDNVALGKSLAGLAQGILISGDYAKRGMMPLRDVQSAVNLRTAKHLGLDPGRLQRFNMTFPEQ